MERTGSTGAWAVSIIATGMPAEKQLQFREHIRANCNCKKPWDPLEIEFTSQMPGEPTLYRDYKLQADGRV